MTKFIVHGIQCPNCIHIFARIEDEILFIIQIGKDGIMRTGFHAECLSMECNCIPKHGTINIPIDMIPDDVKYRIVSDATRCRIVYSPCRYFYHLEDIIVKRVKKGILPKKLWWEINCKKCNDIHVIKTNAIKYLPAHIIDSVDQ